MTCVLSPKAFESLRKEKKKRCSKCGREYEYTYQDYLDEEFTWIDRLFGHYPPKPGEFKEK